MNLVKTWKHRGAALAGAVCLVGTLAMVLAPSASSASGSGSGSGARYGGTFQIAFQSSPTTFDPQVCYDATCWVNMELLFNRLYNYETGSTTLAPEGASAMPVMSDGGRVYTISIRKGMEFSNGKPVTAYDFAYSFSRICNPATKSPVVGFWDEEPG